MKKIMTDCGLKDSPFIEIKIDIYIWDLSSTIQTTKMATIKSNTEELKVAGIGAYSKMLNATLEEYEDNMRVRFGYDEVNEDYIDECRYYEVNMLDNTEDEAIEAIGKERNALAVSRIIMEMVRAVLDFNPEIDEENITELGKLYTTWRYVVTNDVEWEDTGSMEAALAAVNPFG